jgi:hypothetical protein
MQQAMLWEEPSDFEMEEPPDWRFEEEPPDWEFDEPTDFEPPDEAVLHRLADYAPPIPSADTFSVPPEVYGDVVMDVPTEYSLRQPAPEAIFTRDPSWQLQHSGIIIEADGDEYAVGVLEVWNNPLTGEQNGAYLPMAQAPHLARAEEMQSNIYNLADEAGVSEQEFGEFAHGLIKGRGTWQALSEGHWALNEDALAPDTPDFTDDAIWAARDQRLDQAFEAVGLQREAVDHTPELTETLQGLGIQIKDFDPASNPPPLFDETTQTAYWIGVYQPDPTNQDQAITAMLSLGTDEGGQPSAHLAPVATGDYDHAYQTAEYLLSVAERTQDVGRVLDAAEGMAVATQHREFWQDSQGIRLQDDIQFTPLEIE